MNILTIFLLLIPVAATAVITLIACGCYRAGYGDGQLDARAQHSLGLLEHARAAAGSAR